MSIAGRRKADFIARRRGDARCRRGGTLDLDGKQATKGARSGPTSRQAGQHLVSHDSRPIGFIQPIGLGPQRAAQLSGQQGGGQSALGRGTQHQRGGTVGGAEPVEKAPANCESSPGRPLAINRPATCQRSTSGAIRGRLSACRSTAVMISRRCDWLCRASLKSTSRSSSAARRPATTSIRLVCGSLNSRGQSLRIQSVPSGVVGLETGTQTAASQGSGQCQ